MPKRRRENPESEESIETGNVDEGDFSDGEESGDDGEDTDKYRLKNDDIEGQEDPTLAFDGEVQITPFNMQEEMEEGHFDKDGMYIFKKRDKDEIKDHWLDNIDWVKVNNQNPEADEKMEEETEAEESTKFSRIESYKEMLNMLKPGETVLKALKRLGGNRIQTASERWKKKKQSAGESSTDSGNKEQLLKLTELADTILSRTGNMDVYQETYEGIRFKVQQAETPALEKKLDAELDMFGEEFDEQSSKAKRTSSEQDEGPSAKKVRFEEEEKANGKEATEPTNESSTTEVQWQFKWDNTETAEVHGPHTSQEMQEWVDQGYFDPGVWVRRVGQSGDFYSSKRIDFELYL